MYCCVVVFLHALANDQIGTWYRQTLLIGLVGGRQRDRDIPESDKMGASVCFIN